MSTASSGPALPETQGSGIRISITNQHGQCYRYCANAVSLSVKKGVFQVVEKGGACFIWFEHCDLEVRDTRRTIRFRFKAGAASNLDGTELVILAHLLSSTAPVKAYRRGLRAPVQENPLTVSKQKS